MKTRIYKVTQDGNRRLVRAATQAAARSHVAKSTISVEIPSPDELYEMGASGIRVEEASEESSQREIGE